MGVYRQWRQWCKFPHYFFDDPSAINQVQGFKTLDFPVLAANATDDLWAVPKSRDAFLWGFENADISRLDIDPAILGLKEIGHMGYFRSNCKPLWENALHWFDQKLESSSSTTERRA